MLDRLTQNDGPAWFAVQARTTHEKRVASLLSYREVKCFLPLYTVRRRWSDRIKEVELPLFPGYVFCNFDTQARAQILRTPSVTGIVGIGGKPIPIDDSEISALERIHQSGFGLSPHPFLQVGQRVRIDGGSLEGLEGIIVDTKTRNRLVLSVSLLQRSVAVEIDSAWVQPIQSPAGRTTSAQPLWSPAS